MAGFESGLIYGSAIDMDVEQICKMDWWYLYTYTSSSHELNSTFYASIFSFLHPYLHIFVK